MVVFLFFCFSFNEESDSMDIDFEGSYDSSTSLNTAIKIQGYSGKQLFKCLKCDGGFDNSIQFRAHLSKCIEQQAKGALKPYRCFHCNKDLRSVYSLAEHIKIHGTVRYGCSLCDFKHPSHLNVRCVFLVLLLLFLLLFDCLFRYFIEII